MTAAEEATALQNINELMTKMCSTTKKMIFEKGCFDSLVVNNDF